jgi:hypothetical protein
MISDPIAAKHISDAMREIFHTLDESYQQVEQTGTPDDVAAYKRAIGRILTPVFVEVLNPLYREHPGLKPPDWDTESEKNSATQL